MKMKKSLIAVLLGSLCLLSACDKPTQSAQSTTAQAAPAEPQVDYKQLALNKPEKPVNKRKSLNNRQMQLMRQ